MENDYDMSETKNSIKPYVRSKRLHSMLTPMDQSGLERDFKRFKYSNKCSSTNSEKKISPVFGLNQSTAMEVDMNYGQSKQEMYKKYIFCNFRMMSEKLKNEMSNYYQQMKQGDNKYLYRYKECSKNDCINN